MRIKRKEPDTKMIIKKIFFRQNRDRLCLFFYAKIQKRGDGMFKDEFLEKIFSNREMSTIPIGCQSTAVKVFQDILEEIKEENPYELISALFDE